MNKNYNNSISIFTFQVPIQFIKEYMWGSDFELYLFHAEFLAPFQSATSRIDLHL